MFAMMAYVVLFIFLLQVVLVHNVSASNSSIDPNNPSSSDPVPFPNQGNAPPNETKNPWPLGLPSLPPICDAFNMTDECLTAMDDYAVAQGRGGYLWLDQNSACDPNSAQHILSGWWDAQDMLEYVRNWPDAGQGDRGRAAGSYWMGADWPDYQSSISGNIQRAVDLVNAPGGKKNHIIVTCDDPGDHCDSLGGNDTFLVGHTWNKSRKGWTYGYMTLCYWFFSMADTQEQAEDLGIYLKDGLREQVTDVGFYQTSGQILIRELMHMPSVWSGTGGTQIQEQYITNVPYDAPQQNKYTDFRVFGPFWVHQLALRSPADGGGAAKSAVNADSYAILANDIFWWDVNGVFPAAPTQPYSMVRLPNLFFMPIVNLDNNTDPVLRSDVDARLRLEMQSYTDNVGFPAGPAISGSNSTTSNTTTAAAASFTTLISTSAPYRNTTAAAASSTLLPLSAPYGSSSALYSSATYSPPFRNTTSRYVSCSSTSNSSATTGNGTTDTVTVFAMATVIETDVISSPPPTLTTSW